jgi:hypothetical protein
MEILRKDLYERVWTTPLSKLALEFGVSNVGLAKACRRHAIPTPPRGHWMRVEHGKSSRRPPLPSTSIGDVVELSAERSKAQKIPVNVDVAPKLRVQVAPEAGDLSPFARATRVALTKAKPTGAGLVFSGGSVQFACGVSPALAGRAALILDAIERALPGAGGKVSPGADKKPLALDFDGQAVVFSLAERHTRTEFISPSERNSPYPRKEYAYHLTGELKLSIEGYFEGRKSWADGARACLEEKLGEVLAGLVAAALSMRRRDEERKAQHLRWEEEARVRAEREALQRRRAAFRDAFAAEAAGWREHHAAAEYLAYLRKTVQIDGELPKASAQWLADAEQAVMDLDPCSRRARLLQDGYDPAWQGPFGQKLVGS